MRYEVLGSLRVTSCDGEFALSASKLEVLLSALIIRSNQIVSLDQLCTELWEGSPPRRAAAGIYVYISQLRKFLVGIPSCESAITTRSPGYTLIPGRDKFDSNLFQETLTLGRRQLKSGNTPEARSALERALAYHRGPVLGGLRGGPILTDFATWAEESRLECLEMLAIANLKLDRYDEVAGMMYPIVAEHPLRETFYQLLMMAHYRSGRKSDALRVYQHAHAIVKDELGLEPCRPLRELHQAILREDDHVVALYAV
jgi:SARP family transcriptional regulator, regulator of embCAB operon